MSKEELFDLLKEHLKVEVDIYSDYDGPKVQVTILFDGEIISRDYDHLPRS